MLQLNNSTLTRQS